MTTTTNVRPTPASVLIGYARVSTGGQDTSIQEEALRQAGADIIRLEKASGGTRDGRDELASILEFIRADDVLVVTKLDRLGRNTRDVLNLVHELEQKGASLRVPEQPIDTSTAAGKAFLDMLGVFAEFETNLRRERQLEGIAKAKAAGVYKGRPVTFDRARILALRGQGLGATAIAKAIGCKRGAVYKALHRASKDARLSTGYEAAA
jgi:DNA invertase Pin-like site-specific DNA recombinase